MCIIAIKPRGQKMFPRKTIETMFSNNPDGAGVMYYDLNKKKVIIDKGFTTVDDLLKYLDRKDFTNTPLIIHFRISTSGSINKLNCHPYPVYKQNKTHAETCLAMCHNGVLKQYEPPKNATYNDTQNFIWKFIKRLPYGFTESEKYLMYIKKEIGDNNKLCFLDDKGRVVMVGKFEKDNGYYYSNTSYLYDYHDLYKSYYNFYDYDYDYDYKKYYSKKKRY